MEWEKPVQIENPELFSKLANVQNLCSSLRFLIGFAWEFHGITIKKSSKSIRGVAKAGGPAPDVAKSCKWTMFLKQKR